MTRNTEPHDAPDGPIGRWFIRVLEGNGENDGGLLGTDTPSPRLEGWLEQRGILSEDACRRIKTAWLNAITKRKTAAKREALIPLLRECHTLARYETEESIDGERIARGKGYWRTFDLAHKALRDPHSAETDEDAGAIAIAILESGVLDAQSEKDLPKPKTIEGWFKAGELKALLSDCD